MAMNWTTGSPFDNGTEYTSWVYVPRVWPLWLEVTVPIVCVLLFICTLVIIFYKPSKPGDKPFFYIPYTKRKHDICSADKELQVIRVTSLSNETDDKNNIVI